MTVELREQGELRSDLDENVAALQERLDAQLLARIAYDRAINALDIAAKLERARLC